MTRLPKPLPDVRARTQATGALSSNLFVEAGAGSGKTTSLVSRVVNMVASGVPVGRIAAITFTEAAARELRTRVRDELERQGEERRDQLLITAAGQVEGAAFTTLHGFALRLLVDHPVEAGLPPGFAVADEIASMLEFDESWRLFVGQIGDDLDLLDIQERADVLGVELRRFADIARRFDDNWDLLAEIDHDPPPLSELVVDDLLDDVVALAGMVDHCLDPADRLAAALLELSASVEDCRRLDPLTQLEWLEQLKWPAANSGRKTNWVRMDVDQARKEVKGLRSRVEDRIAGYRIEVIGHFVARVARFVEQRVDARQKSGELAFHDLLVLARQLLRSNPGVREELHQRYTNLLLDEFQDTDPIQIELAVLIAADGDVGARPWQELAATVAPGRLVVVGDPKQSIYRFRRADIGVYAETEQALGSDPIRLTSNFRSVPGIVTFLNEFFGELIGDGEPGAQPGYVPLDPIRAADPELDVPVRWIGQAHDRSVSVGEIRELEAVDVAAAICRAMEEEWRIERDDQWRPVRLADIAVLIPSRLSLPALEAAFSTANIPFRPETSSLVYATQEVRDVLAGVRAVVDAANSVDVVAALRSGLFAIGDDDLLDWYLAGRSFDYTATEAGEGCEEGTDAGHRARAGTNPIAEAFEVLAEWHRDRWWVEPSALIERIVRERRLREAALAEPRPRDRWRRYRFLADQAREFTATKGGDLQDFVAWSEIQSSDLARVTEPIPAEPDDDSVRVLTVHGSKGLEFPMVILAGAPTQETNRGRGPQVLFPRGESPEVKLAKGKATQLFDVHASVEEVLDAHERVRLHYVAATRARDLLVLSAHHKEGLKSSGRRTWDGLQTCLDLVQGFERRGDERYRVAPPTQLRLAGGDYAEGESSWRDEHDRLLRRNAQVTTYSATGLAEELFVMQTAEERPATQVEVADSATRRDEGEIDRFDGGEPERWRRGRAATAFGIAVHATLQAIDFHDTSGLRPLAVYNADRQGIGEEAADVQRYVEMALGAPAIELASRYRHWRELYVAAPVGDALLEGYVDLCVESPEGLVVVDYKTDLVRSEADIEAKLDRYRIQAAVYAVALEELMGKPVAECRFVFIGPDGVTERTVQELGAVRDLVRSHILTR